MRTNDIVDIYVGFVDKKGGKYRPVLIIKLTEDTAWLLKITSKYLNKSEFIRKYYYPIFDWKEYGLDKASFVDTKSFLKVNLSNLHVKRIRGHFSLKDLRQLKMFIDKNNLDN